MPQHITVSNYNPEWVQQYLEEEKKIKPILWDQCVAVYHIGSTSVPGLAAKPVIDILCVVKSLEKVDNLANGFIKIGYEYLGEFGIKGRRYLRKGGDERTHQIHIFQLDDTKNIQRHLAFRDYMRAHEQEREEYSQLKKALAQKFPYDIDGYCDGKEAFIKEIEGKALAQYNGIWDRLYFAARKVQAGRRITPFIEAGGVASALVTKAGHIYVGVCIDTASTLGMCAERNAIANMITNGESQIEKIVAVMPDGTLASPCGACREYMMQLDKGSGEIEILLDIESKRSILLKALIPDWWGANRCDN